MKKSNFTFLDTNVINKAEQLKAIYILNIDQYFNAAFDNMYLIKINISSGKLIFTFFGTNISSVLQKLKVILGFKSGKAIFQNKYSHCSNTACYRHLYSASVDKNVWSAAQKNKGDFYFP